MLIVKCPEYLNETMKFAQSVGALEQLQGRLDYLTNFPNMECELYRDLSPHCFQFAMYRGDECFMRGGLIYSGPGQLSDGGGPSFCVSLDPRATDGKTHMWQVHT